ncbi:uncharacterized protein LOC113651898 [Tachysurus fulvidraco]|uniref:uncharacterized protein LOC113651898 n=1 Tax=Tachysurus fulvidraco TaxID=1234273 RepID=UPI001FED5FC4|nr:uncharacterized protein LOC113651898 [Tachysurus fulvidraco]
MTQSSLHFVSWNTNGIKDTTRAPQKFSKLLISLSNLQADVAFIQETHVGTNNYQILEDVPGWRSYFTVHSSRSKGVAILIRDSVVFEYICHDEDYSGGYIVLFCKISGELYTLVNVYNHKVDRNVLGRLKEYLMETAEGVLVVGGDFNTVLHPSFDQRSNSEATHSPLRAFVEDFTFSLNLRDIWSYKHPTDEGFTRCQNDSYSRLDMFFLPDNKMGRVANINVAHNEAEVQGFSDHYPLIVELTVQRRPKTILPEVASALPEPFTYIPDRRPGKISGAEILSAIKSLTNVGEHSLDNDVKHYKKQQCQLSETLKTEYNTLIKNKDVGEICSFNVKYLIFSQILAKRLSESISPSFKEKIETNLDPFITVTFETGPQKIKWSFLETKLKNFSDLTLELDMLDYLLSKEQDSSELRLLKPGCPLTKFIFSLALNELEALVLSNFGKATVCHQRQVLRIHTTSVTPEFVDVFVIFFKDISGLTIRILT